MSPNSNFLSVDFHWVNFERLSAFVSNFVFRSASVLQRKKKSGNHTELPSAYAACQAFLARPGNSEIEPPAFVLLLLIHEIKIVSTS